mgnify:CR=1 FL=1
MWILPDGNLHRRFCQNGRWYAATTHLLTLELSQLSKPNQLRVYFGGVWHNLMLCILTWLVLSSSGLWLFPFYETGRGAFVAEVTSPNILQFVTPGTLITSINDVPITQPKDWYKFLDQVVASNYTYTAQFCVSEAVRALQESTGECCSSLYTGDVPCWQTPENQTVCLRVSQILTAPVQYCGTPDNLPCTGSNTCLTLNERNQHQMVLRIGVVDQPKPILIAIHPLALSHHLVLSDYVPRWVSYTHWLSTMPWILEQFLK